MPQVTKELGSVVRETGCSMLRVVAHVGTNDASRRGSEEILDSFEDLVSEVARLRESSGISIGLSICSIVPRIDRGRTVWSRVEGLNRRLRNFCRDKGVDFGGMFSTRVGCLWIALEFIIRPRLRGR